MADDAERPPDPAAAVKICSHPLLIPDSEAFYPRPPDLPSRADQLLNLSLKFQWLDIVLKHLHRNRKRVLLLSQIGELLILLDEFVTLRGYSHERLLPSMSKTEKAAALERYHVTDLFIFIAPSMSLTFCDTAIIFDPDFDLELPNPIRLFRVITFQTPEHELFLRTQRRIGLWMAICGTPHAFPEGGALSPPPPIKPIGEPAIGLLDLIRLISTVAPTRPLRFLPSSAPFPPAEETLEAEEFLQQFPLKADSPKRRPRPRDFPINREAGLEVFARLQKFGYGRWQEISEIFDDHSAEQIYRFCIVVIILSLRALPATHLAYLPILISRLLGDTDFDYRDFLCINKHSWMQIFPEYHLLSIEAESARRIRTEICDNPFEFLSIVEMRLVADRWCVFNNRDAFRWDEIAPPHSNRDRELFSAITDSLPFDPFDLRVQAVVNRMRSDIITAGLNDDAFRPEWWTRIEFEAIVSALKNYPFEGLKPIDFHAKTTILGKSTDSVLSFAQAFLQLLDTRDKGAVTIPGRLHQMRKSPDGLWKVKGFTPWTQVKPRECDEIAARLDLIAGIRRKLREIGTAEQTDVWGDFQTRQFLEALLEFGVDTQKDLLIDERFGFRDYLAETDLAFAMGRRKRRVLFASPVPDFLFAEEDLLTFVRGSNEDSDGFRPLVVRLPSLKRLGLSGQTPLSARPPRLAKRKGRPKDDDSFDDSDESSNGEQRGSLLTAACNQTITTAGRPFRAHRSRKHVTPSADADALHGQGARRGGGERRDRRR